MIKANGITMNNEEYTFIPPALHLEKIEEVLLNLNTTIIMLLWETLVN